MDNDGGRLNDTDRGGVSATGRTPEVLNYNSQAAARLLPPLRPPGGGSGLGAGAAGLRRAEPGQRRAGRGLGLVPVPQRPGGEGWA